MDLSQPRVYRLAFERQHAEYALMHAAQGLSAHKAFQAFDAKSELSKGQ
jgi:hypothetical protein